MSDHHTLNSSEPEKSPTEPSSRRNFLKKGALAAPLLAMAASRPVWGSDDSCINSGTLSGNLSDHGCQAIGRSPGWWWNSNGWSQWIYTDYSQGIMFGSIFGYTPLVKVNGQLVAGPDLDIGSMGPGSDSQSVDMHVIAAILNFTHPGIAYESGDGLSTPVYTSAAQVIAAYQDARASNYGTMKSKLQALLTELDNYDSRGHDVFL
jgi:hypothetical protein